MSSSRRTQAWRHIHITHGVYWHSAQEFPPKVLQGKGIKVGRALAAGKNITGSHGGRKRGVRTALSGSGVGIDGRGRTYVRVGKHLAAETERQLGAGRVMSRTEWVTQK